MTWTHISKSLRILSITGGSDVFLILCMFRFEVPDQRVETLKFEFLNFLDVHTFAWRKEKKNYGFEFLLFRV